MMTGTPYLNFFAFHLSIPYTKKVTMFLRPFGSKRAELERTLETNIAGSFGKKSISQILLKHTAKVLIFLLFFVSLHATLQYFKRIIKV